MLAELACLSIQAGRINEAESRAHQSLVIAEQLHDHAGRIFGVGLLAAIAAQRGEPERAEALWGAIEHEDAVAPLGGWRRHRETCKTLIQKHAGGDLANTRANGRTLTLDEAIPLALRIQNIETEVGPATARNPERSAIPAHLSETHQGHTTLEDAASSGDP
jgi:hypothetical protein